VAGRVPSAHAPMLFWSVVQHPVHPVVVQATKPAPCALHQPVCPDLSLFPLLLLAAGVVPSLQTPLVFWNGEQHPGHPEVVHGTFGEVQALVDGVEYVFLAMFYMSYFF
tara:strand:- start:15224 stop:15550 length:327 start_codon:yes stop_codon:yes gene_type:complete